MNYNVRFGSYKDRKSNLVKNILGVELFSIHPSWRGRHDRSHPLDKDSPLKDCFAILAMTLKTD
ncbi:hypothetical protein [Snuella lapsa]|uniref:hypothetical protein n=1 Tax=Snuella lapsa TaxID=870481 RepID=UPI0031EC6D11